MDVLLKNFELLLWTLSCRQLGDTFRQKVPPIDSLVAAIAMASGSTPKLLPAASTLTLVLG
jgi:hypothetical protein